MRTKLALTLGIILSSGVVPHSLQDSRLPQQPQTASIQMIKSAPNVRTRTSSYTSIQALRARALSTFAKKRTVTKKRVKKTANKKRVIKKQYKKQLHRQQIRKPVVRSTKIGQIQHAVAPNPRVQTLMPVFDQDDIKQEHKELANWIMKQLPSECHSTLKNFYVRYDKPKQRGLAGKSTMILAGHLNMQEYGGLFVHEIGHVFDLNENEKCLGGTVASGPSEFKDGKDIMYNDDPSLEFYRISWIDSHTQKPGMRPQDFVTGYAAWDVFEDFAESFAFFVLHNDAFKQRAQNNLALAAKYKWFEKHLFPHGIDIATSKYRWDGKVPWDSTKLAYEWKKKTYVADAR